MLVWSFPVRGETAWLMLQVEGGPGEQEESSGLSVVTQR